MATGKRTARPSERARTGARTVYVLNGPNLNLLGTREPEIYGRTSLADIRAAAEAHGAALGFSVDFRQTNHEGILVDWIQEAGAKAEGLILNAAGYTHTSIAIHDALKALAIVKIELHLSNIHAREDFRRVSRVSPVVDGLICGFGADGYTLALDAFRRLADKRTRS